MLPDGAWMNILFCLEKKQTKIKHLKTNVDLLQVVFVVPAEAYESAKFNLTVQ